MFVQNTVTMSKLFTVSLLLLFITYGYTQERINAVNYTYNAFYDGHTTTLVNHTASFNFKQQFTNSSIVYTGRFNAYNFEYKMIDTPFTKTGIEDIHTAQFGIVYNQNLGNNWNITAAITPKVVADFGTTITGNDVYPDSFIGVEKITTGNKKSKLTFGLGYKGYFGEYRLLPLVNFSKKINEKFSFMLGIPETSFTYKFNQNHSLTVNAVADGFYAEIRGENYFYDTNTNNEFTIDDFEMAMVTTGLTYNYTAGKKWMVSLKLAHNLYDTLTINGNEGSEQDIDFNNNVNVAIGFTYFINFK